MRFGSCLPDKPPATLSGTHERSVAVNFPATSGEVDPPALRLKVEPSSTVPAADRTRNRTRPTPADRTRPGVVA